MKINHEKIVKSWGENIPNHVVESTIDTAKIGLEFVKTRGLLVLKSEPLSGASLYFSDNEGIVLYRKPDKSASTTFFGEPNRCNFESIGFELEQIFGACEQQNRLFGDLQEGPIPLVLGKEHRRSLAVLKVLAREHGILISGDRMAQLPQTR